MRTYPFVRVSNAGCSSGEEIYSIAILLHEEGLYDRTRIHATDIIGGVLDRARTGSLDVRKMGEYAETHVRSGDLVSDRSFNEFHVILCRNVLIYFAKPLHNRVHDLVYESLVRFGVLALGHRESIAATKREACYEELDGPEPLYRRVA